MKYLSLLAFLVLLLSCEKSHTVYVDEFPIDSTITDVELENYINRSYIAILNRKPSEDERISSFLNLSTDPYDRSLRGYFIEELQSASRARWVAWQMLSDRILDGLDTSSLSADIERYESFVAASSNVSELEYWQALRDRSLRHYAAYQGWLQGDSSYTALNRCMFRLPAYDEINMGTENFVVSVYQHAFHRYPTDAELSEAISIAEHNWSTLYGSNGNSKEDFLRIITQQNEYWQGLIITLFEQYLYRAPDTHEVLYYLSRLNTDWGYSEMQHHILTSSEYVKS